MGGARSPLGARSVSAPASAAGAPEAAPAPAPSGMRAPAPSVTGASAPDASAPDAAAPAPGTAAGEGSPASPRSAGDPGELQRRWADVVKRVTAAQASRGALLQSSRARSDDGERLVIGFPKGSGFAIKMLGRSDSHELIAPIVEAVFGPRVVDYVMDGEGAQTSAPGSPSQGVAPVRAAGPSASRGGADAAAVGASPASSPVQGGAQGASTPVAASPEGASAPDGPAPSAGAPSAQADGAPSVRAAGAPSGGSAEPAPGPATPSAPGAPRPAGAPADRKSVV